MLTKNGIIKELQRCAEENNGKTPGEKAFYAYSGIGIYDLKKHGWAFYGELVKDTGLTPNKFDKTKYTNEQLCKLFIKAIRDKKKWPTRGELDVLHHKAINFPDSSTFYNKLGKIKNLALPRKILEFTEDKKGYGDIVAISNSVIEKYEKQYSLTSQHDERKRKGWVYLFRHGNYTQYRIGRSYDLLRRGKEIRIQLPKRAVLIHTIETIDPEGIETYWLNRYKNKKMNGDWFNLSRNEVNEFKRWKRIA